MMFEPSALPVDKTTPLSVDLDKLMVALGMAWRGGRWQAEFGAAYMIMWDRDVTTGTIVQLNPTRPGPTGTTAVGNGHYHGQATVWGAGVRYALD
jgi:long-subunit fatty acid transport protein